MTAMSLDPAMDAPVQPFVVNVTADATSFLAPAIGELSPSNWAIAYGSDTFLMMAGASPSQIATALVDGEGVEVEPRPTSRAATSPYSGSKPYLRGPTRSWLG
jgi:hypothetical protein